MKTLLSYVIIHFCPKCLDTSSMYLGTFVPKNVDLSYGIAMCIAGGVQLILGGGKQLDKHFILPYMTSSIVYLASSKSGLQLSSAILIQPTLAMGACVQPGAPLYLPDLELP